MKKLKLLLLSSLTVFFSACGPTTDTKIDPSRGFDMWEYMTSSIDYEVKYDIYENGVYVNNYYETHRLINNDRYERESSHSLTTLYANGSKIFMKEPPTQDLTDVTITIERYVNLGDRGIFRASSIQMCTLERFYDTYERKGSPFNNVLMVNCISQSGVIQDYYYGYNEGMVAIYENDGVTEKEWIKAREVRI